MRIARAGAIVAMITALGCQPDIGSGTYYCGPERLCPESLLCDEPTFVCVQPSSAASFECPRGANDSEPDNTIDEATDLGTLRCGIDRPLNNFKGCIDSASDSDLFRFEYDDECSGSDPHISFELRYPIALAAIELELLDEDGAVLERGELCTPPGNFSGSELICLEARLQSGTYFFRVLTPSQTPNCDGACHYNQFTVNLSLPLQ